MKKITIILPPEIIEAMEPLLIAYREKEISPLLVPMEEEKIDLSAVRKHTGDGDAMMVIGPKEKSPAAVLESPVIRPGKRSSAIPVSWLPNLGATSIRQFAITAAHVHLRQSASLDIAVLSQRFPRFIRLAERIESILSKELPAHVFRWTGEAVYKEDMLKGLSSGLGVAIYVGHGRPMGWVGYQGTRIHDFKGDKREPLGALLNLCCLTASRKGKDVSFAELIPFTGVAASSFGAINSTTHPDNTRWAVNICGNLKNGASTVGELIIASLPERKSAINNYRLIGDPMAPLLSEANGHQKASRVKVFK
ncbi:MAG: hypothetical protein STSR0002_11000 [Smithella sp.]|jgi:hypothetical protein|nr:C25 family cysteine peptidase [Candidatus Thermoplasmatota archaeon]